MKEYGLERVEVVGLGQACVDYLGSLVTYPPEDRKIELTDLRIRCGGPASTALITLSRLGIPTSFLGAVSDDPFGVKIIENLKREKIDSSSLIIRPGYTSQFSFISITEGTGRRTIFWHRGTVPHLKREEVDIRRFPNARVLHVDGLMLEAATEAARQARESGMIIVMDAGTMRPGSIELVRLVDVLIASDTFATPLVGPDASPEAALLALRDLGPKEVIVTMGPRGSIGLSDEGFVFQGAFPVNAVDTTGAGDIYHGAYIYGVLQDWNMPRSMRFASGAAALKCTEIGAQTAIPDLETLEDFLGKSQDHLQPEP
ncbi:MAG: PfkB family carbohydrate kinase [Pseudomonadota bacterium]